MTAGVPVTPGKLRRKKRPVAPDVCRERGWPVGAELASDDWGSNRLLLHIGPIDVELREHGAARSRSQFVKTLPADVRRVA